MHEELMKLYRKHRVNPLGGCLPYLFQMPIYISLFQVLTRLPELRGERFFLIKDLASPDALIQFSRPLPFFGTTINILPILSMVGMFLQQQLMKRPPETLTEEQRAQQQIFSFTSLFLGFLFYRFPSGFLVYFLTNSFLTVSQYFLSLKVHRA